MISKSSWFHHRSLLQVGGGLTEAWTLAVSLIPGLKLTGHSKWDMLMATRKIGSTVKPLRASARTESLHVYFHSFAQNPCRDAWWSPWGHVYPDGSGHQCGLLTGKRAGINNCKDNIIYWVKGLQWKHISKDQKLGHLELRQLLGSGLVGGNLTFLLWAVGKPWALPIWPLFLVVQWMLFTFFRFLKWSLFITENLEMTDKKEGRKKKKTPSQIAFNFTTQSEPSLIDILVNVFMDF